MNPAPPTFYILGATKCGTTSLHSHIRQHPQVFMPAKKELHFYDRQSNYSRGFDWYVTNFFQHSSTYQACGEATPYYFHCGHAVAKKIAACFLPGTPKFILVFRNPVDRAWSHYLHAKRNLKEHRDFEEALECEKLHLSRNMSGWVHYFRDGLYAQQLEPWLTYFDRRQFLFLITEEMSIDTDATLQQIFKFLDVRDDFHVRLKKRKNIALAPKYLIIHQILKEGRVIGKIPFFSSLVKTLIRQEQRIRIREKLLSWNLRPLKAADRSIDHALGHKLIRSYLDDI